MSDLSLSLDLTGVNLNPEPKVAYTPRQLLTPLPTPGEFLFVIDNSSLEVFTTCPTSAKYKLVMKREAHARNAALTFGGAIHEGLEMFLQHQCVNAIHATSNEDRMYQQEMENQAILRFFSDHPTPLDEYRTVQNALAILAAYRVRSTMPDYQWEIMSDSDGPIIERAFELPLGVVEVGAWIEMPWLTNEQLKQIRIEFDYSLALTPPTTQTCVFVSRIHIAWSGRIDAIAKVNGRIRVVDHKTTSIAGDSFVQDFQISNQVLGYVWAGRQMWPDFDLSAFCLNAIHFKKPTGAGPINAPGPRGGPSALNFFRAYFEYSPERVNDWADNCLTIVSDFLHCLVRDKYPRHTKWCFGKYGKCPYHDVCVQDSEVVRHNMLNSDMYKAVTWNPVAGR
jgi:hypothetical protein